MVHTEHDQAAPTLVSGADQPMPYPVIHPDPTFQPAPRPVLPEYDVIIIGAGLAGLAAGIFLRQAHLRVVCIEPEHFPHDRVGESLDWSAPGMLQAMGLSREQFIQEQVGTYKRDIGIVPLGQPAYYGHLGDWLRRPPLSFEVTTLHVDRVIFDQRLFERAQAVGVTFLWDRVTAVETDGERVVGVRLGGGPHVIGRWFLDGSGQARVLGKALGIPTVPYGRRKVCLWTYFAIPPIHEGTTFYGDTLSPYLSWIWEIPITPTRTSVGTIMTAEDFKARRPAGMTVAAVLHQELVQHPRFARLLQEQPVTRVRTCSYQSYVSRRVCGSNWLLLGEAASLPDPLTANGVTAAFRHARHAAEFIQASRQQGRLNAHQRYVYTTNVRRMGHAFNHSIERLAYEGAPRRGLGAIRALKAYTIFSYPTNALYTKFWPRRRRTIAAFGLLFAIIELWMEAWSLAGRVACWRARAQHARPAPTPARPVVHES